MEATSSSEKPNHLSYLTQFRVDPCPLFKQHQCQQHRPYTCFNWHFANQRRRRPVRKPDGSFSYSPDIYCDRYDENTGVCPDGDACPFLHRVSGDVERKYHLRYYKTAQCVHATDSRGQCVKNGQHCAFAHSAIDLRQPQHDPNEAAYVASLVDVDGRDRTSFVVEDPLWHSQDHVLSCYKTELCRKPARLCRQGYACPFYHNSKDRRRPPAKFTYRSTPCPAAKTVEEWLDPEMCENGDNCGYCHTRTEQQFHPEIYKSTKCNDMLEHGYCPRAVFCAFAHHDSELHKERTPYLASSQQSPTGGISMMPNGDSPTDLSRFGSPIGNGVPSAAAALYNARPIKTPAGYRTADDIISSSYPKAPGYERGGPLSPSSRMDNQMASRFRTHSLNMGHLSSYDEKLSAAQVNFGSIDMITAAAAHNTLNRSDSGFNALNAVMDELTLDMPTINESYKQYNATSPMHIPQPTQDAYHHSPHQSYNDSLLQPSKMNMVSPIVYAQYNQGQQVENGMVLDELFKTKEQLTMHHENAVVMQEGLEQAKQACAAFKNDAEVYRMIAHKAEQEKNLALAERDRAYHELETLRARINSDVSETTRQALMEAHASLMCVACGRDRTMKEHPGCPMCTGHTHGVAN